MASLRELARKALENKPGCTGKIRYDSQRMAMLAAVSVLQRNGDANGKPMPYHCAFCGGYHIGRKRENAKQKGDYDMLGMFEKNKVGRVLEEIKKPIPTLSWVAQRVAKGRDGVFSELAEITPEIAQHLLDYNDDNRRVTKRLVDQIATDIAHGKWQVNGEAIIVSKDGHLNDGQHRLNAVLQAKKPIKTIIIFGVERDSRFTVDMGRARSTGDFLEMNHVKNGNWASAITSLHWAHRNGYYRDRADANRVPVTKQMMLAEYQRFEKEIQAACRLVGRHKFFLQNGISPIGLAYILCRRANPQNADYFFEVLATGEGLKRGSPILMLRNWMIETKQMRFRSHQKLEMILRYWNAWVSGKTLQKRLSLRGEYPEVVG